MNQPSLTTGRIQASGLAIDGLKPKSCNRLSSRYLKAPPEHFRQFSALTIIMTSTWSEIELWSL